MMKGFKHKKIKVAGYLTLLVLLLYTLLAPLIVYLDWRQYVYTKKESVPSYPTAIVYGAGVSGNGYPKEMLEDRLKLTAELYVEEKITTIIVSGNNSNENNNETVSMENYLTNAGVDRADILQDPYGYRTYDTCARTKEVYGVEQALLISQGFHLPRALMLCNELGVESAGISATKRDYKYEWSVKVREFFAIHKAIIDLYIFKPTYNSSDR